MPKDDVTPIRQQYLEIKREYPNTILFCRLGDFYETFDEAAEVTARELDIVLTSKPIGKGTRGPDFLQCLPDTEMSMDIFPTEGGE